MTSCSGVAALAWVFYALGSLHRLGAALAVPPQRAPPSVPLAPATPQPSATLTNPTPFSLTKLSALFYSSANSSLRVYSAIYLLRLLSTNHPTFARPGLSLGTRPFSDLLRFEAFHRETKQSPQKASAA